MGSLYVFCVFLVAAVSVVHCQEEKDETAVDGFDINEPMHFWNWKQVYDYWKNKGGFTCPAIYGRYAHPKECSLFYECRFGVPHLMQCIRGKLYDEKKEQCRDKRRVKCKKSGRDDDDSDSSSSSSSEEEEDKNQVFQCPYIWGTFAHPIDCSKYFVCIYNVPTLFQCYGTDLYDDRNRRCKDKRRVKCGKRLDRDQMRTSRRPFTLKPTTPAEVKSTGVVTSTAVPTTTKGYKFACPFPYGRYPDPLDCSQYYECRFAIPTLVKCPPSTLYDERKENCLEDKLVKCGDRPGGVDGDSSEEEKEKGKKEEFICPYIWGTFPHPDDCSKYIICIYNVPTVFNCRKTELFHAYYRRCFPSDLVTCDYRINPDDLTPPPRRTTPLTTTTPTTTTTPSTTTTPTTTPIPTTTPTTTTPIPTTTPTTTTPIPTTTPTTTTPVPTTTPTTTTPVPTTTPTTTTPIPTTTPTTTTPIPTTTPTTTTKLPSTKRPKPNTPPPTDCDEDDIDCIIDETGDVKRWFDCPQRYGHFPHGSSYQLFIHCDNYQPFIKRCAEGTAFSPKYLVCMWIGKPIPRTTKRY